MSQSYYEILGVGENASEDEIRKAYRKRIRACHPDLNPDKAKAEQRSRQLNVALEVLGNPEKRELYDTKRRVEAGTHEDFDFSEFTTQAKNSPAQAPLRSAPRAPAKRKSNAFSSEKLPLWIGLGIVGLAILIGLTVAIAMLTRSDDGRSADREIAASNSSSTESIVASLGEISEKERNLVQWKDNSAVLDSSLGNFKKFTGKLQVPQNCALLMDPVTFEDFKETESPEPLPWRPKFCFSIHKPASIEKWSVNVETASVLDLKPFTETNFNKNSDLQFADGQSPFFIATPRAGAAAEEAEVLDLTTGLVTGKFSTAINKGNLSVDGKHFVCLSKETAKAKSGLLPKETKPVIQVWKADKLDEPAVLVHPEQIAKEIRGLACINETTFAALYFVKNKVHIEFFDFDNAESKGIVELPDVFLNISSGIKAIVSPDKNHFVVTVSNSAYLLSASALNVIGTVSKNVAGVAFGRKGKRLYCVGSSVVVWSVETGKEISTHQLGLRFNANRSRVFEFGGDRIIVIGNRLFDLATSSILGELKGIWPSHFHGETPVRIERPPTQDAGYLRTDVKFAARMDELTRQIQAISKSGGIEDSIVSKPEAPEKWLAVRLKDANGSDANKDVSWPASVSFTSGKYGVSVKQELVNYMFQRWDMESGKTIGSTKKLEDLKPEMFSRAVPELTPITISADGKTVALAGAKSQFNEVIVLDEKDETILKFKPYDDGFVEWLGFNSQGQLLTLGAKKLTAWTIPEGKPVYCVDGNYRSAVQHLIDDDLLIVSAGNYCDFIDTSSGKCTNRHYGLPNELIVDILVDPKRDYLYTLGVPDAELHSLTTALQGSVSQPSGGANQFSQRRFGAKNRPVSSSSLVIRKLKNGKAKCMKFVEPPSLTEFSKSDVNLHSKLSLLGSDYIGVISAKDNDHFVENNFKGALTHKGKILGELGPEKDFCQLLDNKLSKLPRKNWSPALRLDRPRTLPTRELPITVRASGLNRSQCELAVVYVARQLEAQGFKIGKGGPTLDLSGRVEKSELNLSYRIPNESETQQAPRKIELPNVKFTWTLKDTFGNEVFAKKSDAEFPKRASRYYSKTGGKEFYNFETSEPFEEVLQEMINMQAGLKVDFMPSHVIVATDAGSTN